ncbi:NXPE family member 3-like [Ictidomys tridecemlineatus]|uniref:NXPE family member 3-like n=1 Tax=Ictidomys tridecemlineatus TaxID=43179 RepID=UPI00038C3A36|nr:NXPE family member 3-like [Ictidomys tridecemlineatus]KAG3259947.1 NXPE family member 3-like [Ictidomys tridecemlineatus]
MEQFKSYKILIAGLLFLVCVFYFKMSWTDNIIFRAPGPQPVSKYVSNSVESPSLLDCLPQELSNLTHLLYWPLTPGDGGDFLASTSPMTSTYHLRGPAQDTYALGGYLEVVLVARDHQGRPKTHGGDLFQARLLGPELRAGVPGDVQDLENGTYLLSFPLLWAGKAQVQVRLIHSSEAVGVLRRIWEEKRATVNFKGYFQGSSGVTETVICNVDPHSTGAKGHTCQYRDVVSGELWFCAQPPTLPCNSLVAHSSGSYLKVTTPRDDALLADKVTDKLLPQGVAPILIRPATTENISRALKPVDLHSIYQVGPLMAVETTRGIVLHWRAHSWPLRSQRTPVASLHSVAKELEGLAGGPHTVVVLGLGAHFTTFPPSIFARRLAGIRAAVMALLEREPSTLVVIKLANTGYKSVYGSDWFTLHMNRLLRAAFAGLRVAFVDAWEMTSSLALPDNIHPRKLIVSNEVNLLLSFICPT